LEKLAGLTLVDEPGSLSALIGFGVGETNVNFRKNYSTALRELRNLLNYLLNLTILTFNK
jgi:hypothetical protein